MDLNKLKMELQNYSNSLSQERNDLMFEYNKRVRKDKRDLLNKLNNFSNYRKVTANDLSEGKIFKFSLRMLSQDAVYQVFKITYSKISDVDNYTLKIDTYIFGTNHVKTFHMSNNQRIYVYEK